MLRISKLADYGTVVMVYLVHCSPALCSAREIALHTHLTVHTVSKLLKRLSAAKLLLSVRGAAGGYRLSRLPTEISLADIIYALDAQRGLVECRLQPNECMLQGVCHIQNNWRVISQTIESLMDGISLAAFAQPTLQQAELDQIAHTGVRRG